jgi:hypothetical protein
MIIACVGDISKLQIYIWSSYGLLAEIKKFFSLSSPLFFEVYGLHYRAKWQNMWLESEMLSRWSLSPPILNDQ